LRLLLDTNVLLWLMTSSPRLSTRAVSLIRGAEAVYVSTASIWEIAIKWRIGKLEDDPQMVVNRLEDAGLHDLQITNRHAVTAGGLPLLHHDPFDRLLIAQAICEQMHLLTADARLAEYSELVIVCEPNSKMEVR
jgi:PIN domain nuclease of toxin-antitoxin system